MELTLLQIGYLSVASLLVLVAAGLVSRSPGDFELVSGDYWRWLSAPWKLVTFVAGLVGINALVPVAGVATWDYVNSTYMAILAWATAPWSLGVLVRALRGTDQRSVRRIFVALVVWLFSASWSYELYLVLRDGYYPTTWAANLVASSGLYAAAGVFWSVDRDEEGLHLAFVRPDWPTGDPASFRRVAPWAVPLLVLVGLMLTIPLVVDVGWLPW